MLDYSGVYIGADSGNFGYSDYTPDVLKHAISNVMLLSSQGRVKSSLRSNQPSGDIEIWDQSYAQIVANAIGSASKADIDSAFSASGGERSHVNTSACSSESTSSADVETLFSSKLLPFL